MMSKFNIVKFAKKKLKKFPPYYNLKFILMILKICGSWAPMDKTRKCYIIRGIFILTFTLGHLLFAQTAFVIARWSDTEKIAAAMSLLINNYVHAFKTCVMFRYQKRIKKLYIDANGKKYICKNPETLNNLRYQYSWAGFIHYSVFQIGGLIACTSWTLTSIFRSENDRILPMNAWYPYNVFESPKFEFTIAYQAATIYLCCMHNIAMDGLIIGFMAVIGCEFEILKIRIKEIGDDVKKFGLTEYERINIMKQPEVDERLYKELVECVEHHIAIINYAREFEAIFKSSIFLQFLDNCLVICITAFALVQETEYNSSSIIGNLMYLMAIIYQLFMYCYFGNGVSVQSESVVTAAFAGNWWQCGERYKRGLRLLMARANIPVTLKAGNLLTLSLQTFVAILRASYSFFTVLQSATDKNI